MKTILIGNSDRVVKIDDDFELPTGGSLNVNSNGYARILTSTGERRPSGSYVYTEEYLHRRIAEAPPGQVVMFIDGDRLNLQKENLLVCERAVSIRHSGGTKGRFKGVHFSKKQMKWIAQLTHNYKCFTLGSFDNEEHAADVYNKAAVRIHGKHAYTNILPEDG